MRFDVLSNSVYALRALLDALAPLIGAEDERGGKAVGPGWASDASEDQIKAWAARGKELVKERLEHIATEDCAVEYGRLMHKVRIALPYKCRQPYSYPSAASWTPPHRCG